MLQILFLFLLSPLSCFGDFTQVGLYSGRSYYGSSGVYHDRLSEYDLWTTTTQATNLNTNGLKIIRQYGQNKRLGLQLEILNDTIENAQFSTTSVQIQSQNYGFLAGFSQSKQNISGHIQVLIGIGKSQMIITDPLIDEEYKTEYYLIEPQLGLEFPIYFQALRGTLEVFYRSPLSEKVYYYKTTSESPPFQVPQGGFRIMISIGNFPTT